MPKTRAKRSFVVCLSNDGYAASLAEAPRELAAAVGQRAGKPLLAAVDAIQREVRRKRLRLSRKEIAAEVRATRAQRRRRG